MSIVDFILNLAGLLLWLNWRSMRFDPLARRLPATLMGTLRPAAPARFRRWHILILIAILLVLRAAAYHWFAPFWVFKLHVGIVSPSFRTDSFPGMLLFSFLSFAGTLGIFYLALLLLSIFRGPDNIHRFVKIPLGRVDDWNAPVKMFLPFLIVAITWGMLVATTSKLQIFPPADSMALRIEQAVIVALGVYLFWKIPLALLLLLHFLNSYIYFGAHPFWSYVRAVSEKLLWPLRKIPLRAGKLDFAPVLGLALIFFIAVEFERGLFFLYRRLPL